MPIDAGSRYHQALAYATLPKGPDVLDGNNEDEGLVARARQRVKL